MEVLAREQAIKAEKERQEAFAREQAIKAEKERQEALQKQNLIMAQKQTSAVSQNPFADEVQPKPEISGFDFGDDTDNATTMMQPQNVDTFDPSNPSL